MRISSLLLLADPFLFLFLTLPLILLLLTGQRKHWEPPEGQALLPVLQGLPASAAGPSLRPSSRGPLPPPQPLAPLHRPHHLHRSTRHQFHLHAAAAFPAYARPGATLRPPLPLQQLRPLRPQAAVAHELRGRASAGCGRVPGGGRR